MGSKAGVLKVAAKRLGLTPEEYQARLSAGLKWCGGCRAWLPVSDFGKDRSRSDGRDSKCRHCRESRVDPQSPSRADRARMRAAGSAWCSRCRDWKPVAEVRGGLCRPHRNEDARKRYAASESYRLERRQHAHSRKRRVAPMPLEGIEYRLDMFGGECAYCPNPATTFDHLVPVRAGGQTVPENILAACQPCNSSKSDRDLLAWLETRPPIPTRKLETIFWLLEAQGLLP